ncbi:hypothetical protein BN11_60025 [Nostocoides australiense Ben110]|uniref:Uncharacterized protein n=1 Tax=Nostocoides australiense Ben110 TaxID=1193182 RepID=W6K2C2_9MICO|nr:hypothetical protein BN11_60025 [Tetrasphaera australiensis Ben110]
MVGVQALGSAEALAEALAAAPAGSGSGLAVVGELRPGEDCGDILSVGTAAPAAEWAEAAEYGAAESGAADPGATETEAAEARAAESGTAESEVDAAGPAPPDAQLGAPEAGPLPHAGPPSDQSRRIAGSAPGSGGPPGWVRRPPATDARSGPPCSRWEDSAARSGPLLPAGAPGPGEPEATGCSSRVDCH